VSGRGVHPYYQSHDIGRQLVRRLEKSLSQRKTALSFHRPSERARHDCWPGGLSGIHNRAVHARHYTWVYLQKERKLSREQIS